MTTEQKLIDLLTNNYDLYNVNRVLISVGAGTILPTGLTKPQAIRMIALEYSDALADPHDGEWETELGRLTLSGDVDKLRDTLRSVWTPEDMLCPFCRWTSRLAKRRDGSWRCNHCKETWRI